MKYKYLSKTIKILLLFLVFSSPSALAVDNGYDMEWEIKSMGNGYVQLVNKWRNYCLEPEKNTSGSTTFIEVNTCNTYGNRITTQWKLVSTGAGSFNIKNRSSNLCLGIQGNSPYRGAALNMESCYSSDSRWYINFNRDKHYTIKSAWLGQENNNYCLGIQGRDDYHRESNRDAEVYDCISEQNEVWEKHIFRNNTGLNGKLALIKGPVTSLNYSQSTAFNRNPRTGHGDYVFKTRINSDNDVGSAYIQLIYGIGSQQGMSLTTPKPVKLLTLYQNEYGNIGNPGIADVTVQHTNRIPHLNNNENQSTVGLALLSTYRSISQPYSIIRDGHEWKLTSQLHQKYGRKNVYLFQAVTN